MSATSRKIGLVNIKQASRQSPWFLSPPPSEVGRPCTLDRDIYVDPGGKHRTATTTCGSSAPSTASCSSRRRQSPCTATLTPSSTCCLPRRTPVSRCLGHRRSPTSYTRILEVVISKNKKFVRLSSYH